MAFRKTDKGFGSKGPRRFDREERPRFGDKRGGGDRADRAFGSRGGGRNSFSRGPAASFDVTCEKCGKETTVPFKPTGEKPVYCRDCFRGEDSGSRKSFSSERSNSQSNELREINEKLDKIMRSLNIE